MYESDKTLGSHFLILDVSVFSAVVGGGLACTRYFHNYEYVLALYD